MVCWGGPGWWGRGCLSAGLALPSGHPHFALLWFREVFLNSEELWSGWCRCPFCLVMVLWSSIGFGQNLGKNPFFFFILARIDKDNYCQHPNQCRIRNPSPLLPQRKQRIWRANGEQPSLWGAAFSLLAVDWWAPCGWPLQPLCAPWPWPPHTSDGSVQVPSSPGGPWPSPASIPKSCLEVISCFRAPSFLRGSYFWTEWSDQLSWPPQFPMCYFLMNQHLDIPTGR